ncbi:hypothetical protein GCM10010389_66010 [Streptomyces echinoruber]|uniref:Uncharacterized protein n=1 Tax=Streptomyces echinoruber TaxID=68898 RepID=A0A918VSJ1_9ACTN|nr:hypothetical protein GCM10010389_66010 [Streptomyces echinoruber]
MWGPPVWILTRIPLALLALLDVEVDPVGGTGARKAPWRERIWIDRRRLRRERITDPQAQEKELRKILENNPLNCNPPGSGTVSRLRCESGGHHLGMDQSYYRLIGARRALEIAHNEYGWILDESESKLPFWLELTCPARKDTRTSKQSG